MAVLGKLRKRRKLYSSKDFRRYHAQLKGGKLQLRPYMLDITWEAIFEEGEPWKKLWTKESQEELKGKTLYGESQENPGRRKIKGK